MAQINYNNSPKKAEAMKLIAQYTKTPKPILKIIRVQNYTAEDRQGLKELRKEGFVLEWDSAAELIYPRYNVHLQLYFDSIDKECQDKERYSHEEIVPIAVTEVGITHLLDDKGRLHRSTREQQHAEAVHAEVVFKNILLKNKEDLNSITEVWLSNSPCANCSKELLDLYKDSSHKPTIYIGHIYKLQNHYNKKEMVNMARAGFKLEIWEEFSKVKYGKINRQTQNYLREVGNEAAEIRQ